MREKEIMEKIQEKIKEMKDKYQDTFTGETNFILDFTPEGYIEVTFVSEYDSIWADSPISLEDCLLKLLDKICLYDEEIEEEILGTLKDREDFEKWWFYQTTTAEERHWQGR